MYPQHKHHAVPVCPSGPRFVGRLVVNPGDKSSLTSSVSQGTIEHKSWQQTKTPSMQVRLFRTRIRIDPFLQGTGSGHQREGKGALGRRVLFLRQPHFGLVLKETTHFGGYLHLETNPLGAGKRARSSDSKTNRRSKQAPHWHHRASPPVTAPSKLFFTWAA